MIELHWREEAAADVREIWQYIARDDAAAADRMVVSIHDGVAQLLDFPDSGAPRVDIAPAARALVVRPYLVLHMRDARRMFIVRIVHGARDLTQFAEYFERIA